LLFSAHYDHASILHRYGDKAPQMLDPRTHARTLRWFYTLSNEMLRLAVLTRSPHFVFDGFAKDSKWRKYERWWTCSTSSWLNCRVA